MSSFFRELKQRKVYRASEWILPIFLTAVALVFPVVLALDSKAHSSYVH